MSPTSRISRQEFERMDAVLGEAERLIRAARSSLQSLPSKPMSGPEGGRPCGGRPCTVLPKVEGIVEGVQIDLGGKPCGGGRPCGAAPSRTPKKLP